MRHDRTRGFFDRRKETMSAEARRRYQDGWVASLAAHAWRHAPGVRRRMEQAGLDPERVRSVEDLARLPVLPKHRMPDLQKADPPFGGFCAVPMSRVRKIFVSPGPILEPIGPEFACWHAETGQLLWKFEYPCSYGGHRICRWTAGQRDRSRRHGLAQKDF